MAINRYLFLISGYLYFDRRLSISKILRLLKYKMTNICIAVYFVCVELCATIFDFIKF